MRSGPSVYLAMLAGAALMVALGVAFPKVARALTYDTNAAGTALYAIPVPLEAAHPTKLTMAGGSEQHTTPGANKTLRFSCTVAAAWVMGASGSTTATVDDNQLQAGAVEQRTLISGHDTISIFTSAAGTCYVSVVGT